MGCTKGNTRLSRGFDLVRLAYLLVTIFSFTTSIRVSYLHLDRKEGIISKLFQNLLLLWFLHGILGNEPIENPLLSHPCVLPSHKIGSAQIVWLIYLVKVRDRLPF